jgi:putative acetyltransferase
MKSDLPIHIRLATLEDLEAILTLQAVSLRSLSQDYYRPDQIESLIKDQVKYRRQEILQIVADYQGQLVGFASLCAYPSPPSGGSIGGIYVHPRFFRRGIGRQLLKELERQAIEPPLSWSVLRVLSSLAAVPFYKNLGYITRYSTGFWTDDRLWIECTLLTKRLIPLTPWQRWQPFVWLALLWLILFLLKYFT